MHVLVTGGAGYIGSHAALALLERGDRVTVLDSLDRGHRGAVRVLERLGGDSLAFVEGSILDDATLARALAERPDAVIHFAALAYVGESVERPLDYWRTNVTGTERLALAARDAGVDAFVFSSSCATYGQPDGDGAIDESCPQRPMSPYGRTKLVCEWLLRDTAEASDAFHVTALRYFNVAGADPNGRLGEDHRPETHLLPIALEVAAGRRPELAIFGDDYDTEDGTCVRDYVHVSDLVDAHLAALDQPATTTFRAYNVGVGRGWSVRACVEACERASGLSIPTVVAPRRAGDPASLFADASTIRRELGWTPRFTDVESMAATAWSWFRTHPDGYDDA